MPSFSASVGQWAQETLERSTAVLRDSAQTLVEEARTPVTRGGNLPIKKGNLWRSFMASTSVMPSVSGAETFPADPTSAISVVIAGMELGTPLYIGIQAVYGPRMEYGFQGADSLGRVYNQQGFGFVRKAAQRWPTIVAASEAKLKGLVESRQAPAPPA